jgi:hypothetical protein
MKTIYKYPLGSLRHDLVVEVEMPKGAKILDIQMQNGEPMLWAIVNPKHSLRKRVFHVFGTGFEMEDYEKKHYEYVKTVQQVKPSDVFRSTWLVWHVFEVHE